MSFQDPHEYQTVVLGTAKVLVSDAFGKYFQVRAVIDMGSQTSAVTRSLAYKLGLPIRRSP